VTLDIYVDRRSNFERMRGYKLQYMLHGIGRAGLAWRILDRCDVARISGSAFMHVDLTEVPASFRDAGRRYLRCVNGEGMSRPLLNFGTGVAG
jgi:hypothetical protein